MKINELTDITRANPVNREVFKKPAKPALTDNLSEEDDEDIEDNEELTDE